MYENNKVVTKEDGGKESYNSNDLSVKIEGKVKAGLFVTLKLKVCTVDVFSL